MLRVSSGEWGHVFTRKSKMNNDKNRVWKMANKRGWDIRKNRWQTTTTGEESRVSYISLYDLFRCPRYLSLSFCFSSHSSDISSDYQNVYACRCIVHTNRNSRFVNWYASDNCFIKHSWFSVEKLVCQSTRKITLIDGFELKPLKLLRTTLKRLFKICSLFLNVKMVLI